MMEEMLVGYYRTEWNRIAAHAVLVSEAGRPQGRDTASVRPMPVVEAHVAGCAGAGAKRVAA